MVPHEPVDPRDPRLLDDEGFEDAEWAPGDPVRRPANPASTRRWWVIGGTLVALACAVAVWWGISASTGKPTWTTFGSTPLDDRTVQVVFDVGRPEGRVLSCHVQAKALDFGVVGSTEVTVPASAVAETRVTATVRTTSPGVMGEVTSCRFAD